MWALTNMLAPTMSSMTLVRRLDTRVSWHALTPSQANGVDFFQICMRRMVANKQDGMGALLATQWRAAWRDTGKK